MPDVAALTHERVREALRLLGEHDPPSHRGAAQRRLRELLRGHGTVRGLLDQAPAGARDAFSRLAEDGPGAVDALLGRGWWGHGALPPPLDWLQVRALVQVADDGLVHAVAEARDGFRDLALELPAPAAEAAEAGVAAALRVEPARTLVVAASPGDLDRVVAVDGARLRTVAPTVAVSDRAPSTVRQALRAAGLRLADDLAVAATPGEPALPGVPEEAVGPRAIRALLDRAVQERRQVQLNYFASSRGGAATDRVVDPWAFADDLLRGWCHLRQGERTFAVDRVGRARLLGQPIEHTGA